MYIAVNMLLALISDPARLVVYEKCRIQSAGSRCNITSVGYFWSQPVFELSELSVMGVAPSDEAIEHFKKEFCNDEDD